MTAGHSGRRLRTCLFIVAALLAGCAGTAPFDRDRYDDALTPNDIARSPNALPGHRALWGGLIIAVRNLENSSELEVLSYPLDGRQRPDPNRPPQGRFLAVAEGYLEIADYAEGRMVTIAGTVTGTRGGKIGESEYTYPVIETRPELIHLWPTGRPETEPRLNFGIGVMFGR
jgi:outer membrane lipoprotein